MASSSLTFAMRISWFLTSVTAAATFLLITTSCFGQYGGGYGGYGGGGYGGGMGRGGMGNSMGGANFKPSIPNIAGEMAAREMKWLKENLNLEKDQAKSIKSLYNDYAKLQQEAIKEIVGSDGGKSNPDANKQMHDAMMMYNEEKEDKLKVILTPDQWVTYQTKKPDMQREIGGVRPPAPKGMIKDSTTQAKQ